MADIGSPQNIEVLTGDTNFTQMWVGLTDSQRDWLRHKAQWEHMSLKAVAKEWGVPSDQHAKELLGDT